MPRHPLSKLAATVLAAGLFAISIAARSQTVNTNSLAYLAAHQSNPWVTMGLAAAGQAPDAGYLKNVSPASAIDAEAPILAMVAAGEDPRTYAGQDLVAKLQGFAQDGQMGDRTMLNDDVFGILALRAAGVAAADPAIAGSKDFLLGHQNADGGWGFSTTAGSDTNTTAGAIMALNEAGLSAGDSAIAKALDYLRSAQNDDGGMPYDPKSSWGTASDASSDAWAISALLKLGMEPSGWTKSGGTLISNLGSLQDANGFFHSSAGDSETNFTPVVTAYAVVALARQSYPVKPAALPAPATPTVFLRVEGKDAELCNMQVEAVTALDAVKNAADKCQYAYHLKETTYGPYLDKINADEAAGADGWMYLVNDNSPSVGAADYKLKDGDAVLWFYGDYQAKPLRLVLAKEQFSSGENIQVTVEAWDQSAWRPLQDATVHAGTETRTSGADGSVAFPLADGTYDAWAEKAGSFVRSAKTRLTVGAVSQGSLPLTVTVGNGAPAPNPAGIAFSVSAAGGASKLDFGAVKPGKVAARSFVLANQGANPIIVTGQVTGDQIFTRYLMIDKGSWTGYKGLIGAGASATSEVELPLPASAAPGTKNGMLIFWATPAN